MNTAAAEPYRYRPTFALPYWDQIGGFIEDAVADTADLTGREPRTLFPATTAFVLWTWQARGTPLERTRFFRASVVEEFVHLGMGRYLRGSRATHRATLTLMVRALNPADSLPKQRPIPRSVSTEPYSAAEIAALHSWALGQNTSRRRHDALTLLALGLGAGLATREILELRVSSLDIRGDQLVVIVWESRPRVVPVLPGWQPPLKRTIDELDRDDWVFIPGRSGSHTWQVTDFLHRAHTTLDVRPSRMRATWLLHHLTGGTPPQEILWISGLKNLAALDKIATFAPRTRHTQNPPIPR